MEKPLLPRLTTWTIWIHDYIPTVQEPTRGKTVLPHKPKKDTKFRRDLRTPNLVIILLGRSILHHLGVGLRERELTIMNGGGKFPISSILERNGEESNPVSNEIREGIRESTQILHVLFKEVCYHEIFF